MKAFRLKSSLTSHVRLVLCASGLLLAVTSVAFGQTNASPPNVPGAPPMPSLWELAVQGGIFMIPIALASIVAIAFSIERMIGLKTDRILPADLILKLRKLISERGIDPRKAWTVCQEHPSPLANALRAAILKAGRPHAEVEKAVVDAVGRETADMTRHLRPVNVVASIAPLLGLLGTVQGMILAFMVTSSTSSTGNAKAQELAQGIYTALVTTFAGLSVAIVAVLLANYLEGRIERLLRLMEDLFVDLLPHLERFEGKLRVARAGGLTDESDGLQLRTKRTSGAPSSTATDDEPPRRTAVASPSEAMPARPQAAASATPQAANDPDAGPEDPPSVTSGVDVAEFEPSSDAEFPEADLSNEPLPPDKNKVDSPHGLWDVMWEHREAQQVVNDDNDDG